MSLFPRHHCLDFGSQLFPLRCCSYVHLSSFWRPLCSFPCVAYCKTFELIAPTTDGFQMRNDDSRDRHSFIVLQERDRNANISRLDRNGALSYRDLIVMERYHIATWSYGSAIISPFDRNGALLHLLWSLSDHIRARWSAYWRTFALLSDPIALQLRCLRSSCVSIAI